jgi:hypothetical protein
MVTNNNQNWFVKNARTIYFSAASLALGVFATLCLMRCGGGQDDSNAEKSASVKTGAAVKTNTLDCNDTTLVINEDDLAGKRQIVIIKNGDFVNGNKVENDGDNNKTVVSSIDVRGSNNSVDSNVRGTIGSSLTNRDNARNNFSGAGAKSVKKSVKKPKDEIVVNVVNDNDTCDVDQSESFDESSDRVVVNVINTVRSNGGQPESDTIRKKQVLYISSKMRVPIDCSKYR